MSKHLHWNSSPHAADGAEGTAFSAKLKAHTLSAQKNGLAKKKRKERERKKGGGERRTEDEKKNPKAKHDEYTQVSSFYTVQHVWRYLGV